MRWFAGIAIGIASLSIVGQSMADGADNAGAQEQKIVSKIAGPQRSTVTYSQVGDVELEAEFQRPQGDAVIPIVVLVHGGAWVTGSRHHFMMHANKINAAGLAVLSIDYRLAPKYQFPACLDDVREALKYVAKNAETLKIDASRIVLWGYSAGGHLAALASMEPVKDVPRPWLCVLGGTPSDLTTIPENSNVLKPFLGQTRKQNPEVYRVASPISFVSSDDPPTFMYHGDADMLVAIDIANKMYKKLCDENVSTERIILKGQGHIAAFFSGEPVKEALKFIAKKIEASKASEVKLEASR